MPDNLGKFIIGVETLDHISVRPSREAGIAVKKRLLVLAGNKKQAKRRAKRVTSSSQGLLGFMYGTDFTIRSVQLANEKNPNYIKKWEVVATNKTWDSLEERGQLEDAGN